MNEKTPIVNNSVNKTFHKKASAPIVLEKNSNKVIGYKKEIYKELSEKGFHVKMDKETQSALEEEKLKKYMNGLVKENMQSLKANLTGKHKKEKPLKSEEDNIEIDKKHFPSNESKVYGKEFMINKIKEVYN